MRAIPFGHVDVNRAGDKPPAKRRAKLERAKNELRDLYGRPRRD